MKTTRIRAKVKNFLDGEPRTTNEILCHINTTTTHGTTAQQLGNVLSKDKDIIKVGYVQRKAVGPGYYKVCQWALRHDYQEVFESVPVEIPV